VKVGEAAARAGVSAKALRTWERAGLLPPAERGNSGYRSYAVRDLDTIRFIATARRLGFGMARIRGLLLLWQDRARPSAEVKRIALDQAAELRAQAGTLLAMAASLDRLAATCHGDHRPDCPILDGIERGEEPAQGTRRMRGGPVGAGAASALRPPPAPRPKGMTAGARRRPA
jgi:Cu(I)-responsive transcriptional regulator